MSIARLFALPGLALLSACGVPPSSDPPSRAVIAESSLPPVKSFTRPAPSAPAVSNSDIARDFLDLHFQLESGRPLEVFTRFQTPITLRVTGEVPASLQPDLNLLLTRLRSEAGIPIRQISQGQAAITIQGVSQSDIRRTLPQAACFVVPNVSSLDEFRRNRRNPNTSWTSLRTRTRLGIFVPSDASPQELRDCLHEELAQALGPLNDMYRLSDSVFNDDNVHTVLTGFDMLILRATYAPELQSGMTRDQVAAQLPGILRRLNPRGAQYPTRSLPATPRSWINATQTALGPGVSAASRRRAANNALRIAQEQGWRDHRMAFSYYIVGRMSQYDDPRGAKAAFDTALRLLDGLPATDLHDAFIRSQTAAYDIVRGDGASALRQLEPAIRTAARAENAALLSTLMLLKAEALVLEGRVDEARRTRLDSVGWARYGFGSDWVVRNKMKEVASLNPLNRS